MSNTTITLTGEGVKDLNQLNVHISVEATVNVDAKSARRRVTAWLASEVGNMLIAGEPRLVISENTVWRLPALLTSSERGIIGEVGCVDVDAVTGELIAGNELRTQLVNNVNGLIRPTLSPAG